MVTDWLKFTDGDAVGVAGFVRCGAVQEVPYGEGKTRYMTRIMDRTGMIDAVDFGGSISMLARSDLYIEGSLSLYHGKVQLKINTARSVVEKDREIGYDPEQMIRASLRSESEVSRRPGKICGPSEVRKRKDLLGPGLV